MFIVWRKRAITTDRPVELFVRWDTFTHKDDGEKVCRTKYDPPAWLAEPLFCRHTGPGRVTHIPLLMHAERIDGRPRQKLLERFHSIRSCCIADGFIRAAWWHSIEAWVYDTEATWCEENRYLYRDKKAMFTRLKEVVPPASGAGKEQFDNYRRRKEEERQRYREELYRAAQREAEQRRQRQEQQQRQQQQQTWDDVFNRMRGYDDLACWHVLGLEPTPTVEELKKRYRDLAREHHPDRGGDAETFKRIQAAYEDACAVLGVR